MIKELYTAALGMMNTQTRLEVTANNIANVNTPAYKRAAVFERNLIDSKAALFHQPNKVEQNDPPIGSYLDWSAGAYRQTGNPLDIAIEGQGFFVCQNIDESRTLTRNGNFRLNSEGYLVTADGKFVLGNNNETIKIPDYAVINENGENNKQAVDIVISKTGEIFANDVGIAKLLVVDCDNYSQIKRIENQDFLYSNDANIHNVTDDIINIKQSWLENSNVNIIEEMVTMIELQRAFETGSKVIQTNDSTIEKSLSTAKYGYY